MRLFVFLVACALGDLVNNRVSRILDGTTQLLRSSISVEIENQGSSPVSTVQLAPDSVLGAAKLGLHTSYLGNDFFYSLSALNYGYVFL